MIYDVAVVGSGPAGSAAARVAAAAGASVLLLERDHHPRYKCCGGGLIALSTAALAEAGVDLPAIARCQVRRVTLTRVGQRPVHRTVREPRVGRARPHGRDRNDVALLPLVLRADLDAALAAAAVRAGAELREGVTVLGLGEPRSTGDEPVPDELATGGVGPVELVLRDADPVRARVVIAADGATSRLARWVGVESAQVDLGLEGEFPTPTGSDWSDRLLLNWGPVAGSYGWVFPKGDTLTVGVIGAAEQGPAVRAYYRELVAALGLSEVAPLHFSGHQTRYRTEGSPLRRGPVLVAGDAAGLLEPYTREGISSALRSGALAGAAAATATATPAVTTPGAAAETWERALTGYAEAVERELLPESRAGAVLLPVFSRHPGLFALGFASPPGFGLFCRVVLGTSSLSGQTRRPLVRAAARLLG